MDNEYREFGRLLWQARKRRGLKKRAVARMVGVRDELLDEVELGLALPTLVVFARLWALLGFDGGALLDALPSRMGCSGVLSWSRSGPGNHRRFGWQLCLARLRVGMPRGLLARAVGCSSSELACIEAGDALPTLLALARLRWSLDCRVDGLLAAALWHPSPEPVATFASWRAGMQEVA